MTIKGVAGIPPPDLPRRHFGCEPFMLRPGDPMVSHYIEFRDLGLNLRTFLAALRSPDHRHKAERGMLVLGPPGAGKTTTLKVAALNSGYAVCSISASQFAGSHEGDSVKVLNELLPELEEWSRYNRLDVILQVDDFDLSIAGDPDATATVNTGLLVQELMKLLDDKHRILSVTGMPVPIIFTANDATGLRSSLTRDGRMTKYDHIPSAEDKANIAHRVLTPQTSVERDLVQALTNKYASRQPVAFWESLASRIRQKLAAPHVQPGHENPAEMRRIFDGRVPLHNPDIVWAAARELRQHRITNHLGDRFAKFIWRRR